jgi:hypothetical protein
VSELKELHDFFVASAGGAAALIGLLFVAVSISPEKIFGEAAIPEQRSNAERAFTAFGNVFFVSLAALIPRAPLSAIAVIALIAAGQIAATALMLRRRYARQISWRNIGLISMCIYIFEFISALRIGHGQSDNADTLVYIVLGLYAYALGTSWGLLGAKDDQRPA